MSTPRPCGECGAPKAEHQDYLLDATDGSIRTYLQTFRRRGHQYRALGQPPKRAKQNTLRRSKDAERTVAKLLGGRRIPTDGKANNSDVETAEWGVEVKNWGVTKLCQAVDQAKAACSRTHRRPLVVIAHKVGHGGQRQRFFVVEEIEDWVSWNGKGGALMHDTESARAGKRKRNEIS